MNVTPGDGQGSCPKHVELCTRINLEISASVCFIKKKFGAVLFLNPFTPRCRHGMPRGNLTFIVLYFRPVSSL